MPTSLSSNPRFRMGAAFVLLLGVPVALVIRQRHETWLRAPRPVGEALRVIEPAWLTEVDLTDTSREGMHYWSSDPALMRPCLAAAQGARWSSETGAYPNSVMQFHFLKPGAPEDSRVLYVNTDFARRDIGPAMADCVESLRRRGQTP